MTATHTAGAEDITAPGAPMTETRRWLITGSVMIATLMNALDTTVANVSLPYIQGSVQASQDQITWVLTSYLIAAAVMTPLSSWLSQRFGRKQLLLFSIGGFTAASLLCAMSNSLIEIVGFRFLQGLFGASLIPISQGVLLDTFPTHRHGEAMAVWGQGSMLGPILGPAIGGWLTENLDWRWVFLINLPIGIIALLGVWTFLSNSRGDARKPFDLFGFVVLVPALAGLQLMLDRGPTKDWFSSAEIWVELLLAVIGLYLFAMHTATAKHPFFDRALLHDRNFLVSTGLGFFVGLLLFSSMALLPTMMETLLGYPVLTTGLTAMPRGLGSFISMLLVGRMITRFDPRVIVLLGLSFTGFGFWQMTHFNLQMDSALIVWSGVFQGLGVGLIFVPLTSLAFATLAPELRPDGTAVYSLIRSIGAAVGISLMQAQHVTALQAAHQNLAAHLRPDAPNVLAYGSQLDLTTSAGASIANALVTRQASMLTYIGDFQLLMMLALVIAPFILFLRRPRALEEIHVHGE